MTFFLVIAQWRFHVVDDFIPEKMNRMKNIHWNLFPHFDAIQAYHEKIKN